MTIIGRGDLVPRRRRRGRGRRRLLGGVLVVAILGGGGYFAYRELGSSSAPKHKPAATAAKQTCHQAPAELPPPQPATLHVQVVNATLRTGLAAQIEHALHKRGFGTAGIANAVRQQGPTQIFYPKGAAGQAKARTLQAEVPYAVLTPSTSSARIVLQIGKTWHGLVSSAAAIKTLGHERAQARSAARCGQ